MVQGYSPELSWRQLAEGAVAISRGVPWVATNLDPTVPSPRGRLPGNGSLVAALRHATGGEPVVDRQAGPDDAPRVGAALGRATGRSWSGDRLDTDIEGANAVGCAEPARAHRRDPAAELLAAPAGAAPDLPRPPICAACSSRTRPSR